MKKALFTFAIALFAMVAQAQTAFKVHSDGQISLQSATKSYGIQIPSSGVVSFEPNITSAYSITNITKARASLTRAWTVKNLSAVSVVDYQFFGEMVMFTLLAVIIITLHHSFIPKAASPLNMLPN